MNASFAAHLSAAFPFALPHWMRRPSVCHERVVVLAAPTTDALSQGATLVIARPAGVAVHCRRGSLWLTHDGDCRDIVLLAGESYVGDSGRRLLVHALEESMLRVMR